MTLHDSASWRARIFCALDGSSEESLLALANDVAPHVDGFKVGLEFFCARGPDGVRAIAKLGKPIFLDLKFHDIPNTVGGAVQSAMALRPAILTLHAAGGAEMLRAAVGAAQRASETQQVAGVHLVGVSVLTSIDDADLEAQGIRDGSIAHAQRLAQIASESGCSGVVCSPHEIEALRARFGKELFLVVPGVRPDWSESHDQKRIMTPAEAARAGANVLVIGRPITQADRPADAAKRIRDEVAGALR